MVLMVQTPYLTLLLQLVVVEALGVMVLELPQEATVALVVVVVRDQQHLLLERKRLIKVIVAAQVETTQPSMVVVVEVVLGRLVTQRSLLGLQLEQVVAQV
jgi:hypothetical protein